MKKLAMFLLLLIVLVVSMPFAGQSQKAYNTTKYKTTVKGLTATFTFAEGYFAGNEIKLYNKASRSISRFVPDTDTPKQNKASKFIHYSPLAKTYSDFFLIQGLHVDTIPAKIYAVYYSKSRPVKFVLTKQ